MRASWSWPAIAAGAAAGKWEATVIAGGVQSPEPATE